MGKSKENEDPRLAATGIIAGCSVGALAICGVFLRTSAAIMVLPPMIAIGTAVGIAAVWKFGGRQSLGAPSQKAMIELEARVKELEERIETAETLERFEDRLASKEAAKRIAASSSDPKSEINPPDKASGAA